MSTTYFPFSIQRLSQLHIYIKILLQLTVIKFTNNIFLHILVFIITGMGIPISIPKKIDEETITQN